MKRSEYLIFAREEIKKAQKALDSLSRLLNDALEDIKKAEVEQKGLLPRLRRKGR